MDKPFDKLRTRLVCPCGGRSIQNTDKLALVHATQLWVNLRPVFLFAGVKPLPVFLFAGVKPLPVFLFAGVKPLPVFLFAGVNPLQSPSI